MAHLQVVGMFPHVNADDGHLSADNGILVLGRDDAQAAVTAGRLDEPSPARTLDAHQGRRECSGQASQTPKRRLDLLHEGGRRAIGVLGVFAVGGSKRLPEEGMVDVASAVELDHVLQRNLVGDVGVGDGLGVVAEGGVEICDVGLVLSLRLVKGSRARWSRSISYVFVMMESHDLGGDVRFESL